MIRSFYSIRRRILQAFSLWCLLSVPLGYFCFDIDAEVVRAFGKMSDDVKDLANAVAEELALNY